MVVGGLVAQNTSLTMQNTLAVNGLRYEPDLQAGFFKTELRLQNNGNSTWYAKAKILSSFGWAGSASFFLYADASNNPYRLNLLIPVVSHSKYFGLGAVYGHATVSFFVTFEDDGKTTVYFKFSGTVTSAVLKSSNTTSFEIVNEPSGATWVVADGNLSNI